MGQFFKVGLAIGLGVHASQFISGVVYRVMYQLLQDAKDKIQDEETLETEEAAEE